MYCMNIQFSSEKYMSERTLGKDLWRTVVLLDCFQYWNSQFATGWFFSEHHRRTVQPIDEPNPQGDSPNPVQEWFLTRLFETLFLSKDLHHEQDRSFPLYRCCYCFHRLWCPCRRSRWLAIRFEVRNKPHPR